MGGLLGIQGGSLNWWHRYDSHPFADLPDQVSQGCVEALSSGSVVQLNSVKTMNDFKLLQISWVYDLNFDSSRRLLHERGHIPALAASLPERDDIKSAVAAALSVLSKAVG